MAKPHPDNDDRAQAVLYAALHGDPAACARFGITSRSLRNWRAETRRNGSELSETFRRYAGAVCPDVRAGDFGAWMQGRVKELSDVMLEKARQIDPKNPEALRAVGEHIGTLLETLTALTYIGRLFQREESDRQTGEAS
ncbi:hypothetical protein [Rubrivirga sp.]|uniref:hypothetical protein n=1 Tax=Rubrivirga sp. TaxID=1885344 RepID=UPI003B52DD38